MRHVLARIVADDFDGNENDLLEQATSFYRAYQMIISVKTILIFMQTLPYLSVYKPLGVLVITSTRMVSDVVNFLLLFAVITLSFCLGFMGLQSADNYSGVTYNTNGDPIKVTEQYDPFGVEGAMWSPLWAVFGFFAPEQYKSFASVMLWIYLFTSSIILVNLLVAMFSETYTRVQDRSEQEYVYMTFDRVTDYRHVLLATPPLFNAPYIIMDYVFSISTWIWKYCCCKAVSETGNRLAAKAQKKAEETMNFQIGTTATLHSSGGANSSRESSYSIEAAEGSLSRHVEWHTDPELNTFDGKTLAEAYLKVKDIQDTETLSAMTHDLRDSVAASHKEQGNEFYELKGRLTKLENYLEDQVVYREAKLDPAQHALNHKLVELEKQMQHLMEGLGIKPPVALAKPLGETSHGGSGHHVKRVRRRRSMKSHVRPGEYDHRPPGPEMGSDVDG